VPIRIAIAGVGNCASSLAQGICFYRSNPGAAGLLHPTLGGYGVGDIQVVAAFDIDRRKVGRPFGQAIFAAPNNTAVFHSEVDAGPVVQMAPVLDGVPAHMAEFPAERRFEPADLAPVDIAEELRACRVDLLVNYLPVGSQRATEFYAEACISAGVAMVNCIPCFIASDSGWGERFRQAGLPVVGDDIKAQLGATITHRTLARLFVDRGVDITSTYQLNTGGNTDFLNMLARERLASKKVSKTDAVQSQLDVPLKPEQIHVGPSDYVPFLKDNKVCFMRVEGVGFGGVPLNLELRLSVEDSPNSAGVAVDAIRACKLALNRKLAGPIDAASAWTMKHPPRQMSDADALRQLRVFAEGPIG
jgi:myo-inositol-1-phosphate synthase